MMDEQSNRAAYDHREKGDQHHFYKMKYFHANQLDEVMVDQGMGQAIFPKGNRIVFIGPKVYHMITRVNETAGDNVRMSIAGFFDRNNKK